MYSEAETVSPEVKIYTFWEGKSRLQLVSTKNLLSKFSYWESLSNISWQGEFHVSLERSVPTTAFSLGTIALHRNVEASSSPP